MRAVARAPITLAWQVVVIGVLVAALTSSVAHAREYATPPILAVGEEAWVKNTDGTWSGYRQPVTPSPPIRMGTYDGAAMSEVAKVAKGISVAEGTTGQSVEVVNGMPRGLISPTEEYVSHWRTGEPWTTEPQMELGDDVIAMGEGDGTLPSESALLDAVSGTTGPTLALAAGSFAVGVAIGTGVDELLELPSVFDLFGGESSPSPESHYSFKWLGEEGKLGQAKLCSEFARPLIKAMSGECALGSVRLETHEETFCGTCTPKWEKATTTKLIAQVNGVRYDGLSCPELDTAPSPSKPHAPYVGTSECAKEGTGEETKLSVYVHDHDLRHAAFPAGSALKTHERGVSEAGSETVPTMAPLHTPVEPRLPAEIPAPVITHIVHEITTIKPVTGSEVPPSPLELEIPAFTSDELATTYENTLHSEGFTNVKVETLPTEFISPTAGPGDVVRVRPAEGTRTTASTEIDIDANPADSPSGGGIVIPGAPGIKLPKLEVVCTNFPFGVPCWLIEQFSAWSATATDPVFTIGAIKVHGTTIGPASVNLESLEPVMTKIRPFMVLFATIGLVLLFYNFARGGGPPSGGSGDGADDGED